MLAFGLLLGAIWGGLLAWWTGYSRSGRWVITKMGWQVTALGAIGDFVILSMLLKDAAGRVSLWEAGLVIAASIAVVSAQQTKELYQYMRGMTDAYTNETSKQDTMGTDGHYCSVHECQGGLEEGNGAG